MDDNDNSISIPIEPLIDITKIHHLTIGQIVGPDNLTSREFMAKIWQRIQDLEAIIRR